MEDEKLKWYNVPEVILLQEKVLRLRLLMEMILVGWSSGTNCLLQWLLRT